jgi:AcrR family transcriptional regulator
MVHDPGVPRQRSAAPETHLSAADWEAAALDALADDGVAGVAIEPLARRLGVTKGSFYWHFADRGALLRAALHRWEDSYTERVIARVADVRDPRERLRRLVGGVFAGGRSDRIHIALAAAKHPLARDALARVTRRRLDYLEACYAELGRRGRDARRSALLAYTVYVGLVHLRLEAPRELPGEDAVAAYVEHLIEKLVP